MNSKEDKLTVIRGALQRFDVEPTWLGGELQRFDVEPIWLERHFSSNLREKINRLNLLELTISIDIYYGKLIKKHCS